jgi:hypothetical protein
VVSLSLVFRLFFRVAVPRADVSCYRFVCFFVFVRLPARRRASALFFLSFVTFSPVLFPLVYLPGGGSPFRLLWQCLFIPFRESPLAFRLF